MVSRLLRQSYTCTYACAAPPHVPHARDDRFGAEASTRWMTNPQPYSRADAPLAQVTSIFGSSMEVLISVHGETPAARELVHCGSAYATVVSVNRAGDPVPVPFHIAPVSDVEKLRCEARSHEPPWPSTMRHSGILTSSHSCF